MPQAGNPEPAASDAKESAAAPPFAAMRQRFRRNRLARWSLRALWGLVFVAVFADFIANDKPLWCKIEGKTWFPILRQYAVDLGLAKWGSVFFQTDWKEHGYEGVLFAPIPYSASAIDLPNRSKSPFDRQNVPSPRHRHWLGTDPLGHDVAAGLVAGARVALLVGVLAMGVAVAIGVLLGSLAGYFGDEGFRVSRIRLALNLAALFFGWFYGFHARSYALSEAEGAGELLKSLAVFAAILLLANAAAFFLKRLPVLAAPVALPLDLLVMRAVEVLTSIPGMLLLLALVSVFEKSSIFYVMAIIGLLRWTSVARYLRAELLRVRGLGYVEAARAMGFSDGRILLRHALPNSLAPVTVAVAFGVASAILLESALSFLGIGVGAEGVTWGSLLAEARRSPSAWWLAVFPGAAIFATVTIFNLIGEGLSER